MMSMKHEKFQPLLKRVFDREISNADFMNCAAEILGTNVGEEYPKFVWKADHYLTDRDLCENDPDYEETMREDILSLFDDFFAP